MKKAVLILFAASLMFIFTGFAITAVTGFSLPGVKNSSKDYPRLEQAESSLKSASSKDCKEIDLRVVNTRLEVKTAVDSSDQIKLEYQSLYKNEWQYSFDNGVMLLKNNKYGWSGVTHFSDFLNMLRNGDWNFDFGFNYDSADDGLSHTVTLTVPKDTAPVLKLDGVNGSIKLSAVSSKNLSLNTVNCGAEASGLTVGDEISINAVNSPVTMKATKAAKLNFKSVVNGQCSFTSPQIEKISGSFVNGTLRFDSVNPDDYSISYNLVNGSVKSGENSYSGNGKAGSGVKYEISFKGVNSNLYLNASK